MITVFGVKGNRGAPSVDMLRAKGEAVSAFIIQAEDGVRVYCLSRGLGDVCTRQNFARRLISETTNLSKFFDLVPALYFIGLSNS